MDKFKQRIVIVSGAPAVGKTNIMMQVIKVLKHRNQSPSAAKIDCLSTEDDKRYSDLNIPVVAGLSKDLCPDHFLATNLEELVKWSKKRNSNLLIIETAGLCHRCAPGTEKTLNICVVDCMSSIKTPGKIGPILTTADVIVLTKGDMVSQAEREVFIYNIEKINPKAKIVEANGLTGAGSLIIADLIMESKMIENIEGDRLRHPMPSATCSYCVGEMRIGDLYQQGIVQKMDFSLERRTSNV